MRPPPRSASCRLAAALRCTGVLAVGDADTPRYSPPRPPMLLMVDNSNSCEIMRLASVVIASGLARRRSCRARAAERIMATTAWHRLRLFLGLRMLVSIFELELRRLSVAHRQCQYRIHRAHVLRPDAEDLARWAAHQCQQPDLGARRLPRVALPSEPLRYHHDLRARQPDRRRDPGGHRRLGECAAIHRQRRATALAHHGGARDRARCDLQDEHEWHSTRPTAGPAARGHRSSVWRSSYPEHGGREVPVDSNQHRPSGRRQHVDPAPEHRSRGVFKLYTFHAAPRPPRAAARP
jgi:hypothetical protein